MNCINVETQYIKNSLNITVQKTDTVDINTNYLNDLLFIKIDNVVAITNIYC